MPGIREGSGDAFKRGSLKRRLPAVAIVNLDSSGEGSISDGATRTYTLILKNLNADLKIHIAAGPVAETSQAPIKAADVPALAMTMQLTPIANSPSSPPLWLRPVFQDPTLAQNSNNPLAQDLPFGWEFTTNGDDVEILITVDQALLVGTELDGRVVVEVDIEYDGYYWDTKMIQFAIDQVQLTNSGDAVTLSTATEE